MAVEPETKRQPNAEPALVASSLGHASDTESSYRDTPFDEAFNNRSATEADLRESFVSTSNKGSSMSSSTRNYSIFLTHRTLDIRRMRLAPLPLLPNHRHCLRDHQTSPLPHHRRGTRHWATVRIRFLMAPSSHHGTRHWAMVRTAGS